MSNFLLSCFADEISPDIKVQVSVLKQTKVNNVEVRGVGGVNVSDFTVNDAKEYSKYFKENGIGVSSIGSPIGKINITDPFESHLDKFKHCLELSQIFDCKYVRMFSFYYDNGVDPESILPHVAERWNRFIDASKGYDVTLLHENEKDIYGDIADREIKLLDALNSDKVKLIFDPANFLQSGETDIYGKFLLLKPYVEYFHIKDHSLSKGEVVPAGFGDGDVKKILKDAKDSGFNGYLSLEPHLQAFEGLSAFEKHTDIISTADKSSGEYKFKLAYDALMSILEEI